MIERWEPLVNWPAPEAQLRRALPLWQYSFRFHAYLVLEPAPTAGRAVFVEVIRDETEKRPNSFDDIPMTRVRICSPWSGETVISNAMVLGNVSEREAKTCTEIPENLRALTKAKPFCPPSESEYLARNPRHMHMIGGGLVKTNADQARMVEVRDSRLGGAGFAREVERETTESACVAVTHAPITAALATITLVHRTSGQRRDVPITGVYATLVRVEWPMSGMYELSKTSGQWRSSPRSLLKLWSIDPKSVNTIEEKILEEKARKIADFKKQRFDI